MLFIPKGLYLTMNPLRDVRRNRGTYDMRRDFTTRRYYSRQGSRRPNVKGDRASLHRKIFTRGRPQRYRKRRRRPNAYHGTSDRFRDSLYQVLGAG